MCGTTPGPLICHHQARGIRSQELAVALGLSRRPVSRRHPRRRWSSALAGLTRVCSSVQLAGVSWTCNTSDLVQLRTR